MIFTSYILAHNGKTFSIKIKGEIVNCRINEKFICIISETKEMAEDFVVRMRDEFETNRRFRFYYKVIIHDAIEERTGQWTRRAFIFNGCHVLGIGSGQQIRGRIKGAYRVTFLIADDLYSEKLVKTERGRDGIRRWWNAAVKNSVDDLMGKIANLGTILHEDTINVDLMKNSLWQNEKISYMPLNKFEKFLHEHMKINESSGECELPFDDVKDEYERIELRREHYKTLESKYDWELAWPDRHNLGNIAMLVADAVRNRTLALLYQEYFHEVTPNANKRFKREFFQVLPDYSLIHQEDTNWFFCPSLYPKPVPILIRIGIDTASGTIDGDDSAIEVVGILPDHRWIRLKEVYGKFGSRDETFDNTARDLRYGKVITDRFYIRKIGYIDEAFRLAVQYHASEIIIGYAGNEKTIVGEFQRIFRMNNFMGQVLGRKQLNREGTKIERITNGMYGHYSTFSVWHANGISKMEHQLEYLGSTAEDDCIKENALIKTDKGYKYVKDIKIGDMVFTHKGRYKKVFQVIEKDFNGIFHKIKPISQLSLEVSEDHEIFTANNGWKKTKDIDNNDLSVVPIEELKENNGNMSVAFAQLLGYFLAEGHTIKPTTRNKKGKFPGYRISFASHIRETEKRQMVKNYLNEKGIHFREIIGRTYNGKDKSQSVVIEFNDKELWTLFNQCYDDNREKIIPEYAYSLGKDLKYVLEWWIKGDGWTSEGNQYAASTSKKLALGMRDIALSLGMQATINEQTRSRYQVPTSDLYTIHFWDKEGKDSKLKTVLFGLYKTSKFRKNIKSKYIGKVYDLKIEEDHSFVCNGWIIHNCADAGEVSIFGAEPPQWQEYEEEENVILEKDPQLEEARFNALDFFLEKGNRLN